MMFLKAEARLKDTLSIKLDFAGDHNTDTPAETKVIDINKYYTYDVTYVEQKDARTDLKCVRGRITDASYIIDRGTAFSSISLPRTKNDPHTHNIRRMDPEALFIPKSITIDCSSEHRAEIYTIGIDEIRDISLVPNNIELDDYLIGDVVKIELLDGTVYEEFQIDNKLPVPYLSEDEKFMDCEFTGLYGFNYLRGDFNNSYDLLINKQDIKSIEVVSSISILEYNVGDKVTIETNKVILNPEYTEEEDGIFKMDEPVYHTGTITHIIDPTGLRTLRSIVAIIIDTESEPLYMDNIFAIDPYVEEPTEPENPEGEDPMDPDTPEDNPTEEPIDPPVEPTDPETPNVGDDSTEDDEVNVDDEEDNL